MFRIENLIIIFKIKFHVQVVSSILFDCFSAQITSFYKVMNKNYNEEVAIFESSIYTCNRSPR